MERVRDGRTISKFFERERREHHGEVGEEETVRFVREAFSKSDRTGFENQQGVSDSYKRVRGVDARSRKEECEQDVR